MHSYKLIAELQHAAPDNPNSLLLRVNDKGATTPENLSTCGKYLQSLIVIGLVPNVRIS